MESGDDEMAMTVEECQGWIREEVENQDLVALRRTQLAQMQNRVQRKEKQALCTRTLFNTACESVVECETVVKELYSRLGMEYRDTDSEDEGVGKQSIIEIGDADRNDNTMATDSVAAPEAAPEEVTATDSDTEDYNDMAYDMESMPSSPAVTTPSVTVSVSPNKASRSSDTPATPLALSESEPPSPQEDHSDDYSPPSKSKKVLTKHPKSSKRGRLRKGEEKRREPAEATPFVVTSVLQAPTHAPNPATQPPPGLTEEEIKTDMMVLARRRTNTWHQGRITEIKRTENGSRYKVGFSEKGRSMLSGHHIAFDNTALLEQLYVGMRVVAKFKDVDQSWFYSGILAELPNRKNRMRFLIFFDDGTPSYVGLPDIHIVCRPLPEVWEDIENEANREFIKDYIKVYPYPPMAQYRPGQLVNVEFEGVQRRTEVEQIDCSLLCVVFKDDEHKEWVYRGSLRLEHMANIKKRAEEAKDKPAVTRPNTGKWGSVSTTNTIHQTSMANASKPHVNPSAPLGRPYGQDRTTDKSSVITAKGSVTFTHHRCCPACLDCIRSKVEAKHRGRNPLLIPLLCEFRRMKGRRRVNNKTYFHIFYQSPCGLSLSNMTAVQDYLQQTRCDFLFLDMFCLDPFVSVTTTHQPRPYKINILDLTLGRENQPLSCINELNNIRPISVIYNKQRVAASGVSLNTSSDFLVGCDCTDGCRDRSACSCHQLTIQATALSPGGPEDVNAGYKHKRLEKRLSTGIYECNSLCRCDPRMCSNRVVQHGLQLRLQLFMTVGKSWGIRCLDDVAKGTFICTYTGIIMNKKSLGTEGNMYMVNLNHIEGAESKEGYESEARRSDKESGSEEEPVEDVNSEHDDCDGGDDLSNDEEEKGNHEKVQRRMKKNNSDDEDEEQLSDDNYEDKDYDVSEDDGDSEFRHNVSSMERSYITRRHAKILQEDPAKKSGSDDKSSDQQDGKAEGNDKEASNATRRFFDGEESCYIIDAKLEGNVGRYLNHSCHPNLFAQNVFVDTHDLRFPWVAFFASKRIRAGTELAWDYKCELGMKRSSRILNCRCDPECREKL
ncbi:histone-lysine N-methyltransferase SETDB1-A isoform X1 [Coregonus clupeaformis]|uniref:histone-lysine N-methyltransferase SETDB1-A isoform X1 n=1 Tax=Coregonus clupeaformis TaxID=59861 RepID=UPI001BDFB91B|nr:histone-lysine N-methyltransferase SETDB1-A isoform X1 [Coregonus clupeaformis]